VKTPLTEIYVDSAGKQVDVGISPSREQLKQLVTRRDCRPDGWGRRSNPWAMYYVYSPKGRFIVKGDSEGVEKYVKQHFPLCIYRYTFWQKGVSRGHYQANGIQLIKRPKHGPAVMYEGGNWQDIYFRGAPKSAKWCITNTNRTRLYYYRKLPHTWLQEWSNLKIADRWTQEWNELTVDKALGKTGPCTF
jgi:hypothetical protein